MHSSRMRTARFSGRLWGCVSARGCLPRECVCPERVYLLRGVSNQWGVDPGGYAPHGQIDTCENITLPQT